MIQKSCVEETECIILSAGLHAGEILFVGAGIKLELNLLMLLIYLLSLLLMVLLCDNNVFGSNNILLPKMKEYFI